MPNNIPKGLLTLILGFKTINKYYYYHLFIEIQDPEVIELNFNRNMVKLHKEFLDVLSTLQ